MAEYLPSLSSPLKAIFSWLYWTNNHLTDDQRETMKSRLYHVAGYKNVGISTKFIQSLEGYFLVALLDK